MYCREKPTRLHLVRHAEVDEAYHEVFGGQIDMELSSLGHEQAKRLAKFLGGRTLITFTSARWFGCDRQPSRCLTRLAGRRR